MKLIIIVYLVATAAAQTTPSSAGCGNTSYYGPSGVIQGYSSKNLNCNYSIFASSKSLMSFDFESFYTDLCCDFVTISCASDPSLAPQQFSGSFSPGTVWISGCTQGLVNYRTDNNIGYSTGFRIHYNVTEEVATVCGDTSFHGPSGAISSPNYPDNYNNDLDCNYHIYGSNGSSFALTFKSFDVENGYDSLTVSCPTNSSFLAQSYSGYSLPDALNIPWCTQALVNFRTDSSTVSSGFSLNYYVSVGGCGNTAYTGSSGHVTSTNYPNYHPYNQNCASIISAPVRSTFHLYFEVFTLWYYCCTTCDFLEVRCIDNSDYGPYKFCGSQASSASIYIQQCSQVLLSFHSDGVNNYPGFNIQYTVYPEAETTTVAGIPGYTQTTPAPTPEPACKYEHHYGPSGVITSPNYPGNYSNGINCFYYVFATDGSTLSFIFNDFHMQNSPDYFSIDCATNSSFRDQRYSGQTLPQPLSVPWCRKALLSIYTDSSIAFSGFSIDYYVSDGGCGNTVYNGTSGNVRSPNYPSNYGYHQNCSNIIWAPQRSHFHLNFLVFELQDCGDVCPRDWVEVSCLDNNPSDKHRFCGTSKYPVDIYQCSRVLVWFHTDGSNNYQGFNLEYSVYPESEITTLANTTNLPQTTQRPQVSTSEPGCDEFHCGSSGTISSPNYPGNYDDSLKCNYHIQASTGSSITFIFQHFDLEDDKDYIEISCPTNSSFPEQRYSGHTLPQPLTIPGCSQGSVYFSTDTDTFYSGFSIDYFVSEGGCDNTVYTGSSGTVTSPKYPSGYGFYQNCSNIILAPQRSQFHLNFRHLDTQTNEACLCDWVEISCLDNNPAYKYRVCGDKESSLDIYQCTQVLVWFHSDGSSNYQGFDLEYSVYSDQGCGETSYYDPSGVISSPNYAGSYPDGLYCDYDIYTSSSSGSIAIIYQTFNTEECCDHVTVSCPTNSSYPPVTYSGSTLPQPIAIPWCSQGRVNFDTDSSVISTGFSLEYHISLGGCGDTLYPGPDGYLSSPNYPNNYGVSQNCSNIIWTYKQTSYDVSFLHLDLEECCDFVELSCIDNPEYGKHRFTGDSIPPPQYIPQCTQILVWFYTDDSIEHTGFSLEYSIASESDDRKALNHGKPHAGDKVPSDRKPISEEKVLNKGMPNAGEKKFSNGKLN